MSEKPRRRKTRLFPRSIGELVTTNTAPLMTRHGKLYSALLRDWERIVGKERAAICRPERLQFPRHDAQNATLHLAVRPAAAPELTYATEQLMEQCARYFGYRAITRIILHASYDTWALPSPDLSPMRPPLSTPSTSSTNTAIPPLADDIPPELRAVLSRIATHI